MGRRKFEVSDETAYRWCERHRLGDSFRKIALDSDVELRLVAKVVREFDRQKHLEEGTATRREIRAGFLREHLQKIEEAAWDLLQLTASLSLGQMRALPGNVSISFAKPNIESDLVNNVTGRLYREAAATRPTEFPDELSEVAVIRSVDVTHHLLEREAKAIVEDLKAHLPDVWKQLEKWEEIATKYLENWRKLNKHAKNKGIPPKLFESGLRESLRFLLMSQEDENLPRIPAKLETPEDVGLWMFRSAAIRGPLEEYSHSYDDLKAAYSQLEDMLIPSELRQALLKEKCRHCPLP